MPMVVDDAPIAHWRFGVSKSAGHYSISQAFVYASLAGVNV